MNGATVKGFVMTPEQQARLTAAVAECNAAMMDIKQADGATTLVFPSRRYNEETGLSHFVVEITTGRIVIE